MCPNGTVDGDLKNPGHICVYIDKFSCSKNGNLISDEKNASNVKCYCEFGYVGEECEVKLDPISAIANRIYTYLFG